MPEKRVELRDTVAEMLPEPVIIIGYLEHQLDLVSKVALDLSKLIDQTNMSEGEKNRLVALQDVLVNSSVDFDNMSHPLQSYKIPKAIELKKDTRDVQLRYQNALMREGLFG